MTKNQLIEGLVKLGIEFRVVPVFSNGFHGDSIRIEKARDVRKAEKALGCEFMKRGPGYHITFY